MVSSGGSDESICSALSFIECGTKSLHSNNNIIHMGHSQMRRSGNLANKEVVSTTQESTKIVETLPTSKWLKTIRGDGTKRSTMVVIEAFGFCNPMKEQVLEWASCVGTKKEEEEGLSAFS